VNWIPTMIFLCDAWAVNLLRRFPSNRLDPPMFFMFSLASLLVVLLGHGVLTVPCSPPLPST